MNDKLIITIACEGADSGTLNEIFNALIPLIHGPIDNIESAVMKYDKVTSDGIPTGEKGEHSVFTAIVYAASELRYSYEHIYHELAKWGLLNCGCNTFTSYYCKEHTKPLMSPLDHARIITK